MITAVVSITKEKDSLSHAHWFLIRSQYVRRALSLLRFVSCVVCRVCVRVRVDMWR